MFELHLSEGVSWLTKAGEPGIWLVNREELAQLRQLGEAHFKANADTFKGKPKPTVRLYKLKAFYEEEVETELLVIAGSRAEAQRMVTNLGPMCDVNVPHPEQMTEPTEGI